MKKKGFTLMELLAVVVVLAIIALIAIPIILKIVETSKKGAKESSISGYIDAVEKYISYSDLDSEKYPNKLESGKTYCLINDSDYSDKCTDSSIYSNDFIEVKGEKPSDGYIILGNKKNVKYGYFIIGKYEIECNNSKCKYVREVSKYQPKDPEVSISEYPILSSYGFSRLNINADTHKGVKTYYSIDDGTTWTEYTGTINGSYNKLMVKSVSADKLESKVITKDNINLANDAATNAIYDGNTSTALCPLNKNMYINVDSSVWGKNLKLVWSKHLYARISFQFIDSSNNVLGGFNYSEYGHNNADWANKFTETFQVPENTTRIKLYAYQIYTNDSAGFYELSVMNAPEMQYSNSYAVLNSNGIVANENINIDQISYPPNTAMRYYKIDDGEWTEYTEEVIKLNYNQTLYAQGYDKNNNKTEIGSIKAEPGDATDDNLYDGNNSTKFCPFNKSTYMDVDSSAWGKNIKLVWNKHLYTKIAFEFIDSSNNVLGGFNYPEYGYNRADHINIFTETFQIPDNTVRIRLYSTQIYTNDSSGFFELSVIS